MLEELEELRINRNEKGDKVMATIDNKIKDAGPPKRQDMIVYNGMTIH